MKKYLFFFIFFNIGITTAHAVSKWVVEPGVSYYHLTVPSFFLPISLGTYDLSHPDQQNYPATKSNAIHFSGSDWQPNIRIGYRAQNPIAPEYFGEEVIFSLGFSQFNLQNKITTDLKQTLGAIWRNNGGPTPVFTGASTPLLESTVNAHSRLREATLGIQGYKEHPFKLASNPSIGIRYLGLHQDFHYQITSQLTQEVISLTPGNDLLRTDFYGAYIGQRLNWAAAPHLMTFLELTVDLMQSNATLEDTQTDDKNSHAFWASIPTKINTAGSHAFTYRGRIETGLQWCEKKLNNKAPYAMTFSVAAEKWGDMPQVIQPTGPGDKPVHLQERSVWNHFFSLLLTIPFN